MPAGLCIKRCVTFNAIPMQFQADTISSNASDKKVFFELHKSDKGVSQQTNFGKRFLYNSPCPIDLTKNIA